MVVSTYELRRITNKATVRRNRNDIKKINEQEAKNMSLIIRGENLPESCGDCENKYGVCTSNYRNYDNYVNSRPYDCPLDELPTHHGRLIDADELYEQFINEFCNRNCDESVRGEICDRCGVLRAINMIKSAPTIIEAEVSYNV